MSRVLSRPRFLAKVTNLITDLRPDWDGPGIAAAIRAADTERHHPGVIAAAAIDAAMETSTTTPAGITARLRDGWGKSTHGWSKAEIDNAKAPLPHGQNYPRCSSCHREILGGETRETHVCKQRINPNSPTRRAAIELARATAATATETAARTEAEAKTRERQHRATQPSPP